MKFIIFVLVVVFVLGGAGEASAIVRRTPIAHHRVLQHPRRHKIVHEAGWHGAGFAAGHFAGPAGSAAVGAARYRKDLAAGGRRTTKAAVKIGAPIAATAIAGPAGTVGYEAVEHRNWIKRHLFGRRRSSQAHHHRVIRRHEASS